MQRNTNNTPLGPGSSFLSLASHKSMSLHQNKFLRSEKKWSLMIPHYEGDAGQPSSLQVSLKVSAS
jgi:hypothetical protein